MKKIPNPNGKKGCKEHQDKIKEESDRIDAEGYLPDFEKKIPITDSKKRFADLVALDENQNITEIVQVGISTKKGDPVQREKKAIADIEKATGMKVKFVAYKILGIAIVLLTTLGSCYLYLLK